VVAAGDEATARHHYYGEVAFGQQSDVVEVNVEDPVEGFHIEMWAKATELYPPAVIGAAAFPGMVIVVSGLERIKEISPAISPVIGSHM